MSAYYPKWRNESIPFRNVHVTWAETPCEHHGNDGVNYQILKVGEVIRLGDEVMVNVGDWRTSQWVGETIVAGWHYRRKIERPSKPTYTFVEVGEVLQESDEYLSAANESWVAVEGRHCGMQLAVKLCVMRRRAT